MVKNGHYKGYMQSREEAQSTYIAQILDALEDLGIDIQELADGDSRFREVLLAAPFCVDSDKGTYYVYMSLEDLLNAKKMRKEEEK